jgi:hypothetical protein
MGADRCSACRAPVRTAITEAGKIRDLQPDPHPDGNHILITTPRGHIRARVLTGADMPAPDGTGYLMHRCPPPPTPGPACAGCGLPMDRDLSAIEPDHHFHPCCEPDYRREAGRQAAARARAPREAR